VPCPIGSLLHQWVTPYGPFIASVVEAGGGRPVENSFMASFVVEESLCEDGGIGTSLLPPYDLRSEMVPGGFVLEGCGNGHPSVP
jgi:hypothetical protein